MEICLDKKLGGILATNDLVKDDTYLRCNGQIITRAKYLEFFKKYGIINSTCKLPDLTLTESSLDNKVSFYIKCLL